MDKFVEYISAQSEQDPMKAEQIEHLLLRLDLLESADRTLMVMRFQHGISCRQLARMSGLGTGNIVRRTNTLAQRLLEKEYIIVLRNRRRFSNIELKVAYDRYLLGFGYRRISAKRRLTMPEARRIIGCLDRWLTGRIAQKQKRLKPVILIRGKMK